MSGSNELLGRNGFIWHQCKKSLHLMLVQRIVNCSDQIFSLKCRKTKMKWLQVFFTLLAVFAIGLLYFTLGTLIKQQCAVPEILTTRDIIQSDSPTNPMKAPSHVIPSDKQSVPAVGAGESLQSAEDEQARGKLTAVYSSESQDFLPDGFQKAIVEEEREAFDDLLATIDRTCAENNITYFINYGTLLGSYRHHGIIPWDDDADLAMPYADRTQVWNMLNSIGSGYLANKTADTQYRFIGRRSQLYSPTWEWRWPYIDIDLYSENDSHIWFYNSGLVYRYPKTVVFPLHKRPLGRLSLYSPRDGQQYLASTYPDFSSCSTGMQHKLGRERRVENIPCANLSQTFPFVHRSLTWNRSVLETLKLGNKVLYSIEMVEEPASSALVNPYTLKTDSDD